MKPVTPPLIDATPRSGRVCSRWLGDTNCGEPAIAHVIWTDDLNNGFVCAAHLTELGTVWAYRFVHDLGPDCGMPGACFHEEENTCRCPDQLEAAPIPELEAVA